MKQIPAQPDDAIALANLRAAAMKPSLEALGRYDEQRVRERFLKTFTPEDTVKIMVEGQLAGFYVLRTLPDHLLLDHLYLTPACQGKGIGTTLLQELIASANTQQLPIRVGALRDSPANRFYQQQGFKKTHEESFDIYYERLPAPQISLALLADHPDAVATVAQWYFDEWVQGRPGTSAQQVKAKLAKSVQRNSPPLLLLAMSDQQVIGAAELKLREMETLPELEHWIGGVYVDPTHRGEGLARRLVEDLKHRAAEMGIRQLYLQTENLTGGLYLSCGFTPMQTVTYRGLRVLVMVCELT
ncbi:GNAT family N-acetyltransferase [Reinekea blandensis]|uniref:N-acetyltransferase domain-containing protein n=1 Tax=Reinekea blandensis MED297 TaxID=314283 RepID=A4B9J9_9GAMM|nr:GNAT family N-acetyltransferase [Reinekea blandensis]EAR11300.1 hypothetical protein MED297_20472 [Reinekea sp. MED297] [Reinekea blandensis MED297]